MTFCFHIIRHMWCTTKPTAEDVSQRQATQRGAEHQRFSSAPLCIASRWATSLGRRLRRTQRTLAVEANSALRTRDKRKRKGKEDRIYIAPLSTHAYSQSAQIWTFFYFQITPCLPFLRKRSPDGATTTEAADTQLQLTTHLSTRKDGRLNWPGWLTYSGWFTHINGHLSATGQAQDSESSPSKGRRSTAVPHNQGGGGRGEIPSKKLNSSMPSCWSESYSSSRVSASSRTSSGSRTDDDIWRTMSAASCARLTWAENDRSTNRST